LLISLPEILHYNEATGRENRMKRQNRFVSRKNQRAQKNIKIKYPAAELWSIVQVREFLQAANPESNISCTNSMCHSMISNRVATTISRKSFFERSLSQKTEDRADTIQQQNESVCF
jgi:hypothetical protein